MTRPKRGRRGDLWGAAKSTTGSAKLLITSDAPLVSVKLGTALVVNGERVIVDSIQTNGGTVTFTAKAEAK